MVGNLIYGIMVTNFFNGQTKPSDVQAREILDVVFRGILTESEKTRRSTRRWTRVHASACGRMQNPAYRLVASERVGRVFPGCATQKTATRHSRTSTGPPRPHLAWGQNDCLIGHGWGVLGPPAARAGGQRLPAGPSAGGAAAEVRYDTPITQVVTDYEEFPGAPMRRQGPGAGASLRLPEQFLLQGRPGSDEGRQALPDRPAAFQADCDRQGNRQPARGPLHRLNNEYNRAKNLLHGGSVSPEEYDRYEVDYDEAAAQLEVAKANLDLAALDLEWTKVTVALPRGSALSRRMVDPGNLVKADETMMTSIVSLDPLYVYFDPARADHAPDPPADAKEEGQERVGTRSADPDQPGRREETKMPAPPGSVDFTDNRVDATPVPCDSGPGCNLNHFIAPGLFVKVRLPIGDDHPAILVREQALEWDQGRKKVWLLGYDLQWIAAADNATKVPGEGKNLVVVADVNNVLHFRFFDGDGRRVVNTNEKKLSDKANQIESLRKQLERLKPPHRLTGIDKAPVISAVTAIVGRTALLKKQTMIARSGLKNEATATCIAVRLCRRRRAARRLPGGQEGDRGGTTSLSSRECRSCVPASRSRQTRGCRPANGAGESPNRGESGPGGCRGGPG